MKLLFALLAAVALVTGAPTSKASLARYFKSLVLEPIIEELCFEMSSAVCHEVDDDKLRFGAYASPGSVAVCKCAVSPSAYILQTRCAGVDCSSSNVHFDNSDGTCSCVPANGRTSIDPKSIWPFVDGTLFGNIDRVRKNIKDLDRALSIWQYLGPSADESREVKHVVQGVLDEVKRLTNKIQAGNDEMHLLTQTILEHNKRQAASTFLTTLDPAAPTFIPPPKTDITPELINQSISAQPDNTGIVTGAIPVFRDGVLIFPIQLDGPVAPIIPINCSTSLPCGAIGNSLDPEIIIGPKYIQDGTEQTVVADCIVIAVNMYVPGIINYVVQNSKGEVYSLVGSNKVREMNKINTGAPIALTLQSSPTSAKRDDDKTATYLTPKRYQIYKVDCDIKCTDRGYFVSGLDDYCGCMQFEPSTDSLYARNGISAPDATEATMSAEACASMTCINNGGKPAVFNPFSLTCWCIDQPYVEENPSGWVAGVSSRVVKALRKLI